MSVLKTRLKAREGAAATKSWNARIAVCSMNGLANWNDVTDFDVIPVITSADASAAVAARL